MSGTFSRRAAISAALLLLSIAAAAGVAAAPAGAVVGDCTPGSDWGTPRADLASSVVDLINSHRTGMGLVALKVSPTLANAAVWKARHMARYAYMAHDDPAPPVARTVPDRLEACGYPSRTTGWGENIAWGYSSASSVVTAWLNSPGHKANIENPSYRATGVGAASSSTGAVYWSQEFGTYVDSGSTGGGGVTAPTVSLTSGPASSTTSTTASFGWTSTGTVSSTTCSLDGQAFAACSSPKSYSGLEVGAHSFRVSVSNSSGSGGATYSWKVTAPAPPPPAPAPTVSLTSGPGSSTMSTAASFGWTTTGTVSSTTCSLDGQTAVACSSPKSYSGLTAGAHSFRVTVSNTAGSAAATYAWTVTSSTPPPPSTGLSVTLTAAPGQYAFTSAASFAWTTTGTITATKCSLDSGPKVPCSSPWTVGGLLGGAHRFVVTVEGPAGVASATASWFIL
jgi:uncharacterized protein YkwD